MDFVLMLIAYYALHSVLAANFTKEKLYKFIAPKFYRLLFNLIAIVTLIPILLYARKLNRMQLFSNGAQFIEFAGIAIILIGLLLLKQSLGQYDLMEFVGFKMEKYNDEAQLNIAGLNKIVRHPMYLATLVVLIGILLLAPSQITLILLVVTFLYLMVGIRLEEQKLVEVFGDQYRDYQKRTPMLIPFLKF